MNEAFTQSLPRSDADLITAIGSGDGAAYDMLHERHVAAARTLAAQFSADPAEAEEIVSRTFAQLHAMLGEGRGPRVTLRPYLFAAIRHSARQQLGGETTGAGGRTVAADAGATAAGSPEGAPGEAMAEMASEPAAEMASEPAAEAASEPAAETPGEPAADTAGEPGDEAASETGDEATVAAASEPAGAGAAEAGTPDTGEPPFADGDIADLVRSPLYLAFMSLPERLRAVLWHAEIEQSDTAEMAAIFGLTPDGVADWGREACAALREAYLSQHPAADAADEAEVAEVADPGEPLRNDVAPVFLGTAAAAYLSAVQTTATESGHVLGGLIWMRPVPKQPGRRALHRRVLVAGGIALGLFAAAGLVLALASVPSSPVAAHQHRLVAAPARSSRAAAPSPSPAPTSTPSAAADTLSNPATPTPSATPDPTPSATPSPRPTTTPSLPVSPSPSPAPCPTILDRHHRCLPPPATP